MNNDVKLYENTVQVIKALLAILPQPVRLRDLVREYREQERRSLPFIKFGFQNAEEFLCSLKEHVEVTTDIFGNLLLNVKEDENLKHIRDLVDHQRKPDSSNAPKQRPPRFSRARVQTSPELPAHELENLKKLLLESAAGIDVMMIEVAYNRRFCYTFNYNYYGFNTIHEVVAYCCQKTPEVKITRDDHTGKNILFIDPKYREIHQRKCHADNPSPVEYVKECVLSNHKEHNSLDRTHVTNDSAYQRPNTRRYPPSNERQTQQTTGKGRRENDRTDHLRRETAPQNRPKEYDGGSKGVLPVNRESKFTEPKPHPILDGPTNFKCGLSILEKCKEVLKKLPNGCPLKEFPHVYKEMLGEEISLSGGLENLQLLLESSSDIKVMTRYSGDVYLYSLSKRDNSDQYNSKGSYPCRRTIYNRQSNIHKFLSYVQQELPPDYKPHDGTGDFDYLPVVMTEVFSADHFYLVINGKEMLDALDSLMIAIHEYYLDCSKCKKLSKDQTEVGFPCAAPCDVGGERRMHRCRILDVLDGPEVIVEYVDFGTHGQVHRSNLMVLPEKFLQLPSQAIKCCLAYVKAKDLNVWNDLVKKKLELLKSTPGILCGFKKKSFDAYPVVLLDEQSETFFHERILEEEYAEFVNEDNFSPNDLRCMPSAVEETDVSYDLTQTPSPVEDPDEYFRQLDQEIDDEDTDDEVVVQNPSAELTKRFVRPVYLKIGYKFSIINHNSAPYIPADEVASILRLGKDQLKKVLASRNISFPVTSIVRNNDTLKLFCQMAHYNVKGSKQKDETLSPSIQLYSVQHTIDLLNLFEHPSKALKKELKAIESSFDPYDKYWTKEIIGDGDSDEDEALQDEQKLTSTVEELFLTEQSRRTPEGSAESIESPTRWRKMGCEGFDELFPSTGFQSSSAAVDAPYSKNVHSASKQNPLGSGSQSFCSSKKENAQELNSADTHRSYFETKLLEVLRASKR